MSDRIPFPGLDPEGVPDGDYTVTVSGGHVTGLTPAAAAGSSSGELLMQDGVTSPPVPIETEAGDDWLYQG